jgi:hypothetical protein
MAGQTMGTGNEMEKFRNRNIKGFQNFSLLKMVSIPMLQFSNIVVFGGRGLEQRLSLKGRYSTA